ncbi:MAG: hypothetical protein LBL75_00230 [Rickettsiales bacterium]|jgi:hypothetical protein|nr:hypothetical protein [Rickettsiales bacterium]
MKFRRAVFCYLISSLSRHYHKWLILLGTDGAGASRRALKQSQRPNVAEWALRQNATGDEREQIIRALLGDDYFNRNISDIAKLEKQTRKSVMELWDTDPIFGRFPHLRGLARNKAFEKMWAKMKSQKTK